MKNVIKSLETEGYKSIYEGTHSLNIAVRHYFDFMREF